MFGTYTVTLDDGSSEDVSVDNRDFIAFRRRGFRDLGLSSPDPISKLFSEVNDSKSSVQALELIEVVAWLLWNAGERAGKWACDFDAFIEKECVSYALANEEVNADPTQAGSVATSPS
jgi:hypothetical protein